MFQDQAACTPADFDLFFGEYASRIDAAKAICATCPVASKCLQFALDDNIEFGIYGGYTPSERKALVNV
jgi:hypothetical protein